MQTKVNKLPSPSKLAFWQGPVFWIRKYITAILHVALRGKYRDTQEIFLLNILRVAFATIFVILGLITPLPPEIWLSRISIDPLVDAIGLWVVCMMYGAIVTDVSWKVIPEVAATSSVHDNALRYAFGHCLATMIQSTSYLVIAYVAKLAISILT